MRERARHPSAACEAFWLGRQGPLSYPATYKAISTAGLKAGLAVHPHQLRHTWAHEFRVAGGQLDDLAVLGGWSDLKTVARYGASAAQVRAIAWASKHSLGDRL